MMNIEGATDLDTLEIRWVPMSRPNSNTIALLEARRRGSDGPWLAIFGLAYSGEGIVLKRYQDFCEDSELVAAFATELAEHGSPRVRFESPFIKVTP